MFETLPGFRDFPPRNVPEEITCFGFSEWLPEPFDFKEYDAPVLEPLDLYAEKSGEEIVGQLFHFEDKGERRAALRPELTPTLARMAARANSLPKPIKWFNVGEHFVTNAPKREEGVPFINSTRTGRR